MTGAVVEKPVEPTGRADGKTWAQCGDFIEIPWQTAPSPLHWGKGFALPNGFPGAALRQDR
jgi:hypothetical protein